MNTIKSYTRLGCLLALLGSGGLAGASPFSLYEYAVNVDGAVLNNSLPVGVNASESFISTGLGTITTTINGPSTGTANKYVGFYVDFELLEGENTWFNEYGTPHNSATIRQTWEIDEPGFGGIMGDIYGNFVDSELDDSNGVPATTPDDVAMALAYDLELTASQRATITFNLSDVAPGAEFSYLYLQQSDTENPASVYFWSTIRITDESNVPDGHGTLPLLLVSVMGLLCFSRKLGWAN